jgi:alkylhydroperoxidase family enzyme
VRAALDGLDAAAVGEGLRATLKFLEKLTLAPDGVDESDVEAVVAAGVSPDALRDAIDVAAAFNVIDRIADALEFAPQTAESLAASAKQLSTRGYA